MGWTKPEFHEINLSAEIGMYYDPGDDPYYRDYGSGEEFPQYAASDAEREVLAGAVARINTPARA